MTFLKIAWKNLFRNSRRTIIAGSAIGLGLAGLIFTDALMVGMRKNMIDNATGTFTGHGQIHSVKFLENHEVEQTILDPVATLNRVSLSPEIKSFAPRIITTALISSASKSQSITLWGIDPQKEKQLSKMDDRLSTGSEYLPKRNSILIGQGLADELGIERGDRLMVTVAMADSGEPSQELVTVDGIFSFGSKEMDMSVAAINLSVAREMLGFSHDEIHEIAFTLNNAELAFEKENQFWKTVGGKNIVQPWTTIMEELQMVLEMTSYSKWILMGILFFIVGLNIINTLFMAIYERFFEFAVLKSIGTGRFQLFRMIVYEATFLAVIASIIGMVVGFAMTQYVMVVGLNFNSIEYSGITFYEKIYPVIELSQYLVHPAFLIVFTIVISMYPALFAAKMTPAEALKKTL